MADLKTIIKARIDVPGLVGDTLDEILEPALEKLVSGTETTLDDVLKDALYPTLSAALKVEADKLWEKLMKEDAPA